MRKIVLIVVVVAVVLVGGFFWLNNYIYQEKQAPEGSGPIAEVAYQCAGGKSIQAAYYDGPTTLPSVPDGPPTPGARVELKLSDGRELTVPQTISASGVRYANADESVIFWNKGNDAFLTEGGKETYNGCEG